MFHQKSKMQTPVPAQSHLCSLLAGAQQQSFGTFLLEAAEAEPPGKAEVSPQCEAPKMAKLVNNSKNYGLW